MWDFPAPSAQFGRHPESGMPLLQPAAPGGFQQKRACTPCMRKIGSKFFGEGRSLVGVPQRFQFPDGQGRPFSRPGGSETPATKRTGIPPREKTAPIRGKRFRCPRVRSRFLSGLSPAGESAGPTSACAWLAVRCAAYLPARARAWAAPPVPGRWLSRPWPRRIAFSFASA